jgi:amino acid transporter
MAENRRDAGLLRIVGTWGFAASTINASIGAGVFVVPATLAASLGYLAPIALLACAIAIGSVAICFAEGGSRVPTSGGAYGYIEAAFGPMAGYLSGTALWVNNLLASSGIAAALADTVITVLPPHWAALLIASACEVCQTERPINPRFDPGSVQVRRDTFPIDM